MRTAKQCVASLSALCLTLVPSAGCANDAGTSAGGESATSSPVVYLPDGGVEGSSVIIFNRFTQRLAAYDPASSTITSESNAPSFLQYGFPTFSEYFTAGNSAGTGFRIVQVSGRQVETVLELPDGGGIFPLATDGARQLFLRTTYDDASRESGRALASLESGRLVTHQNVSGPVDSGVILEDHLYYTIYVERTNNYELYIVSLDDDDAVPELVRSGLMAPSLFVHDGKLFTSTPDRLVHEGQSFSCARLCWFADELGLLLRMRLDDKASMVLDIIDTRTQEVLETRSDVVDFVIKDSTIIVYRIGATDTLDYQARTS